LGRFTFFLMSKQKSGNSAIKQLSKGQISHYI
jgi:hypothetical protein